MGLVSNRNGVANAGRVACEIQSADELVLTELIFNGVFSALSGEQIVALTSCFVWSEKSDVGVKVWFRVCPVIKGLCRIGCF